MAAVIGQQLPDADPWPFVDMKGYNHIVDNVVPTSLSKGLNFAPIVLPEQAQEWEAYTQETYKEYFGENIEPKPGVSSFGFGMWAKKPGVDSPDGRFHEISGNTTWGSPNQILVPKMHHAFWNSNLLLFQCHWPKPHGSAIDGVMKCAEERAKSENYEQISCGGMSVFSYSNTPELGPGGFMAMPIYPANDPTTLTGFIVGFLMWQEVLEDIFAEGVNGVDCVISDGTQSYTWEIVDGSPVFKAEGDHHDQSFNDHGRTAILANDERLPLNNDTAVFTLSIYPNARLYESYSTSNPMVATIGAVFAIVFTSILFILYDYYVHRDIKHKKNLLDAKRQFVRFVSHEVRTPLNSVCMGLTLLQEEIAMTLGFRSVEAFVAADEATVKAAAEKKGDKKNDSSNWFALASEVHVNAQSSVDVLNDLLNYDKIESGTLALELSVVLIWDLISNTTAEFKLPAANKKITLDLSLPYEKTDVEQAPMLPRDRIVAGDVVRVTQVLRNLISNAIKFTPEGKNIYVTSEWTHRDQTAVRSSFEGRNKEEVEIFRGGELVVKVKDEGAGMSKEQLARLFQQGVQFNVNDLQAGNGSGLGLYIAKGIVEQHGGSLTCDSEGLGLGTTFTMTLPLYTCPQAQALQASRDEFMNGDEDFEDSILKVLIVDDATSNRKLLRRLLENRGHDCEECEDGHIAVEMVQEAEMASEPYDLVLMDYEMPTMNGPDAASAIRKNGSDVFMIGVTGNMMAEDVDYYKMMGVNAVLPKPFKIKSLEDICVEYHVVGEPSTKQENL